MSCQCCKSFNMRSASYSSGKRLKTSPPDQQAPVIYIVDDDRMARESLKWLVESAHLTAVAFDSGEAFFREFKLDSYGCVILDVRMPDINGMELFTRLKESGAGIPIIIVTGHADVAMAVRAMKAGVFDLVEKPYNDALMLELIQRAIIFNREKRHQQQKVDAIRQRISQLTPREYEIMIFILNSKQNKTIASELCISVKTVELHRANMMNKMSASCSTDLVKMVMLADIANII